MDHGKSIHIYILQIITFLPAIHFLPLTDCGTTAVYLQCDIKDFIKKKKTISAKDQNSNKLTHNSKEERKINNYF